MEIFFFRNVALFTCCGDTLTFERAKFALNLIICGEFHARFCAEAELNITFAY